MQAKLSSLRSRIRQGLVLAVVALVLTACGGAGGGSSWFNLPSVPMTVGANGAISALGFPVAALPANMVSQLQAANVQVLEVRLGPDGAFLFANGDTLPHIRWDDESFDTMVTLVQSEALQPTLAAYGLSGAELAGLLPWIQRIGLGARLELPLAAGASAMDVQAWEGDLPALRDSTETTIGPFQLGALAFDAQGNAVVQGVPLSDLGVQGVSLPPMVMDLLSSLQADRLQVTTGATGMTLAAGDRKLPTLAYDAASLQRVLPLAAGFVDETTGAMLNDLVPQLAATQLDLNVSLTGEPGETRLATVPVQVQEDGSLVVFGVPASGASLPADLIADLQEAGVQQLYVNLENNRLVLAVNGELLPVIAISDATFDVLQPLLADMMGESSGAISALRGLLAQTPVGLSLTMPGAEPVAAPTVPDLDVSVPSVENPDVQLGVSLSGNTIESVAGIPAATLADLGVALPALPANVMDPLNSLDADRLQIVNAEGTLSVLAGETALLTLGYEQESLDRLLNLVGSLAGSDITDMAGDYLPLVTGRTLNVVVALDGGETPETVIRNVQVGITDGGELTVYGADLGLGSILPVNIVDALQAINLQRADIVAADNTLYLAANGEALPMITWTDASQPSVVAVLGGLLGVPADLLGVAVEVLESSGTTIHATLAASDGAAAVNVAEGFEASEVTFAEATPPESPLLTLQGDVAIEGNRITAVGELSAAELQDMVGVALPALPSLVTTILENIDAEQASLLINEPNVIRLEDEADELLLGLRYDGTSLGNTLEIVSAFLSGSIADMLVGMADPAIMDQQLMPLLTGANIELTVDLP